jgi:hypothetical protein
MDDRGLPLSISLLLAVDELTFVIRLPAREKANAFDRSAGHGHLFLIPAPSMDR